MGVKKRREEELKRRKQGWGGVETDLKRIER